MQQQQQQQQRQQQQEEDQMTLGDMCIFHPLTRTS